MENAKNLSELEEIQDNIKKCTDEMELNSLYEKRKELLKSIPEFWSNAFLGYFLVTEVVTRKDEQIFNYLSCLDVEDDKVTSGYSITFYFNTNPYFEDEKLTKTFTVLQDGTTKLSTMSIKWKDRLVAEDEDSFFNFFTRAIYKDDEDEPVCDEEVGELIKGDLWTNPLRYFKKTDEEEFDGDEEGSIYLTEEDDKKEGEDDEEEDEDEEEEDRMEE